MRFDSSIELLNFCSIAPVNTHFLNMAVPREGSKIAEFKSTTFLLNVYLLFIYCLFTAGYDKLAQKLFCQFCFPLTYPTIRIVFCTLVMMCFILKTGAFKKLKPYKELD